MNIYRFAEQERAIKHQKQLSMQNDDLDVEN